MTLAEIRADAQRIADSRIFDTEPRTPAKQLARLLVALVDHLEQQPATTLATVNAAIERHWSTDVEPGFSA